MEPTIENPYTPLRRLKDYIITVMPDWVFVMIINLKFNLGVGELYIVKNSSDYILAWNDFVLVSPTPKYLMNPSIAAYRKKNESVICIQPGDTVVDIGACMGDSTLPALVETGRTGKVIAIEPSPQNLKYLIRNVSGYSNAIVLPKAVFNRKCTIPFSIHNTAVTGNAIGLQGDSVTIDVEADTLDNLLEPYGRIDFIKIDVQGFEVEVLEGMQRLLKTVPKIVVETHGFDTPPLWKKVQDILIANGYDTVVTSDRRLHATKPFLLHPF